MLTHANNNKMEDGYTENYKLLALSADMLS